MTTVTWSPRAMRHLEALRAYIARDSQQGARLVADRIIAAIGRLELFPNIGRASEKTPIRELVIPKTPYIVVYAQTDTEVRILAIFHAKQSWHRLI